MNSQIIIWNDIYKIKGIYDLPIELIYKILEYLPYDDIFYLRCCSKLFYLLCSDILYDKIPLNIERPIYIKTIKFYHHKPKIKNKPTRHSIVLRIKKYLHYFINIH